MDNQIPKVMKSSFIEQVELYLTNLDRLIDQDTYWFCERIEALREGNTKRVEFIEKSYLNPLQRKIRELADRMSKLSYDRRKEN